MRLALFLAPCLLGGLLFSVAQGQAGGQVIWAPASQPAAQMAAPKQPVQKRQPARQQPVQKPRQQPVQRVLSQRVTGQQVVFSPVATPSAAKSVPVPMVSARVPAVSARPIAQPRTAKAPAKAIGGAQVPAKRVLTRQPVVQRAVAQAAPPKPKAAAPIITSVRLTSRAKGRAAPAQLLPAAQAAPAAVQLTGTRVSGVVVRVLLTELPAVRVAQQPVDGGSATNQWAFSAAGNSLLLSGKPTGQSALVLPATSGNLLQVQGRSYRGALLVRAVGGEVQVVNAVDMESYLRSVVPSEMPGSWPVAALRAQAIIARTYAAARINPRAPYDLCDTAQCQDYRGVEREYPGSDQAVADTRGEVMSSGTRLADTYFSADSGGYTASSEEAWGMHLPYLQARPDPYSSAPAWKVQPTLDAVTRAASLYGVRGSVQRVSVTKVSRSGRALELTFVGSGGTQSLHGENINRFLRAVGGKSSRIVLVSRPGWLEITGQGFGHGVGLSQEGARNMADQGIRTEQILNFYYPGASLTALRALAAGGVTLGESYPLTQLARSGALSQCLQAQAALSAPLNTLASVRGAGWAAVPAAL